MPEERIPVGAQFLGVQKRVAPHLLQPTHSPDCQNCRPYSGLIGRLGPRKGRTKLSSTAYAGTIRGFWPGSGGGGDSGDDYSLVALDDGSSVTIVPEAAIWGGGGAWGGPAVTSFTGFYVRWGVTTAPTAGPGASPQEDIVAPLTVAVNGATKCVATCPSGTFVAAGELYIYVKFDAGAYQLANKITCTGGGCCGSLTVTEAPTPVDCTGATNLTGIKCIVEEMGETVTLSGDVYVIGTSATLENV